MFSITKIENAPLKYQITVIRGNINDPYKKLYRGFEKDTKEEAEEFVSRLLKKNENIIVRVIELGPMKTAWFTNNEDLLPQLIAEKYERTGYKTTTVYKAKEGWRV